MDSTGASSLHWRALRYPREPFLSLTAPHRKIVEHLRDYTADLGLLAASEIHLARPPQTAFIHHHQWGVCEFIVCCLVDMARWWIRSMRFPLYSVMYTKGWFIWWIRSVWFPLYSVYPPGVGRIGPFKVLILKYRLYLRF